MTLIELLIVIVILTTIVAAAIPLMSPSNDDRRMREAARSLNTFFRAGAAAGDLDRTGRLALRSSGYRKIRSGRKTTACCLELFYVEQQPPYAGFDANSRACVAINPNICGDWRLCEFVTRGRQTAGLPVGWDRRSVSNRH